MQVPAYIPKKKEPITVKDERSTLSLPLDKAIPNCVLFPLIKETYTFHFRKPAASRKPAIKAKNMASFSCDLVCSDESMNCVLASTIFVIKVE